MVNALTCTCGKTLFEPTHQVEEIFKRQIGVCNPPTMWELGHRLGIAGRRRLPSLFQRHGVARRIAFFAPERAQPARCHTHVGVIDMAVDVEICHIAMHPLAHIVGQPADRQHVRRSVEHQPIFVTEPFVGQNPGGDRLKPWVMAPKSMAPERRLFAGFRSLSAHNEMIQNFCEANHPDWFLRRRHAAPPTHRRITMPPPAVPRRSGPPKSGIPSSTSPTSTFWDRWP